MATNKNIQKNCAADFAAYWRNKGYEKGESQPFWLSLLRDVLGVDHPEQHISFEDQVKIDHTAFIDAIIPETHVLIEQKSCDKDLRKPIRQSDGQLLTPFQQAKRYSAELPYSQRPRWVITCNFKEFFIYDMERPSGEPEIIKLEDLSKEAYRLQFIAENKKDEKIQKEIEISIQAGEVIGKLYDALLDCCVDKTNPDTLNSLNVLAVRLFFCMYAEDAEIFEKDQFKHYLQQYQTKDLRRALYDLFEVLDTRPEDRNPYLSDDLKAFPYTNGHLFQDEKIEIPMFSQDAADILLRDACESMNWSGISPAVFGNIFESTLNPETRHKTGAHFTSPAFIQQLISPLLLDELKEELEGIKKEVSERTRNVKLRQFHEKLGSIVVFDPACGSGNIIAAAYCALRHLENEVLMLLSGGQMSFSDETYSPIKVQTNNFIGIEINSFGAAVARVSMYIAELQMLKETEDVIRMPIECLPLRSYTGIHAGNSLRMDWKSLLPQKNGIKLYEASNPPFRGYSLRSKEQTEDLEYVDPEMSKKLDYVTGWFVKSAQLMNELDIPVRAGFISTNSITQGEQVALLWKPLMEKYGIHIDYAVQSFEWESEASSQAAVTCVMIGFSKDPNNKPKLIFSGDRKQAVDNITPYLNDGPSVFIESRTRPICDVPKMRKGNQPTDGGNLIIEANEYDEFVRKEPKAIPFIRRFMGAAEFINNKSRYCLWLVDAAPSDLARMPLVMDRMRKCKEGRLKTYKEGTKLVDNPHLFRETNLPEHYMVVPSISSASRKYIPIGYLDNSIVPSNTIQIVPDATLFHFGVLTSNVHMAWVRTVCGYYADVSILYSAHLVYNNFPWCTPAADQRAKIESAAQRILEVRENYLKDGRNSLGDLYNDLLMPADLREAHRANDRAVMAAYGFPIKMTESECVTELMKMYQKNGIK
ncbi:MAG: hypothetical protein IJI14_13880 [Anaerolineaceae bacterium]|nr:hypothetical protein [Anaerolineaceae bacterium]